jgi:hypothetical protein
MAIEIERKFLVVGDAWRSEVSRSVEMGQGRVGAVPKHRFGPTSDRPWMAGQGAAPWMANRQAGAHGT